MSTKLSPAMAAANKAARQREYRARLKAGAQAPSPSPAPEAPPKAEEPASAPVAKGNSLFTPLAPAKPLGKRALADQSAKEGVLPPPPDFSAATHKYYRPLLAKAVDLVGAKDVPALKSMTFRETGGSGKALRRFVARSITALEATG